MKNSILVAALFGSFSVTASDIFVADIIADGQGLQVVNERNITERPGYDNQPHFDPSGRGLYYTAMFGQGEQAQTDTFYYDLAAKSRKNITNTATKSEYSPTPIDQGRKLSMIYVDETGSQKLWQTEVNTGLQTPINLSIEPVGYHAWGKANDLLLFVLGERMMLQYAADAGQKKAKVLAKDIGRSLRYNQAKDFFTFSQGDEQQVLHKFDANNGEIERLTSLPKGAQYYTWLDKDTVLSASGSKVYAWHYRANAKAKDWTLFADLNASCDTEITRLAVSRDSSKLAYVCEEK